MTERMKPYHCNGCASRWGGANQCHCAACHRTFSGISTFDLHRIEGGCLDPARLPKDPLVINEHGVWRRPADPEDRPAHWQARSRDADSRPLASVSEALDGREAPGLPGTPLSARSGPVLGDGPPPPSGGAA